MANFPLMAMVLVFAVALSPGHAARVPLQSEKADLHSHGIEQVTGLVVPSETGALAGSLLRFGKPKVQCEIVTLKTSEDKTRFSHALTENVVDTVCHATLNYKYVIKSLAGADAVLVARRAVQVQDDSGLGKDLGICGFAILTSTNKTVHVDTLCSHVSYGTMLLTASEELGRFRGQAYSELDAVSDAYAFYAKKDYRSDANCDDPCLKACSREKRERQLLPNGLIHMKKCLSEPGFWMRAALFRKDHRVELLAALLILVSSITFVLAYFKLRPRT